MNRADGRTFRTQDQLHVHIVRLLPEARGASPRAPAEQVSVKASTYPHANDGADTLPASEAPPSRAAHIEIDASRAAFAHTLARLRRVDDRLAIELGQPTGAEWVPADVVCAAGPTLRACIERYADHLGTSDVRVGASLFLKRYTFMAATGALACYVFDRAVPDPSMSSVTMRFDGGLPSAVAFTGVGGGMAGSSAATIAREEAQALLAWTGARLLEEHLFVLAGALPHLVKVNHRMLRTNVAATIMWGFRVIARAAESPAEHARCVADAEAFFSGAEAFRDCGRLVVGGEDDDRQLAFERTTCCLKFLLPGRRLCEECSLPRRPARCL